MLIVVIVFFIVIRRRHQLASGSHSSRGRRRRRRASAGPAPDYDAPYVIYGAPGPNGERQVRVVGLNDVGDSQSSGFKGEFVPPPPYVEEAPPAFATVDQTPNAASSTTENHGFEPDHAQDTSATGPDTSCTATNTTE